MSKFFVGQRVKLVRRGPKCRNVDRALPKAVIGMCGTVKGTASRPNAGFRVRGDYDISVLMDGFPHCAMGPHYCFEPIVADGGPSELSYTELMDRCRAGEVECV